MGARNDSRWLSGGVPDPAYLLTLSLLSSTPAMEHARSPLTGTPFRFDGCSLRLPCELFLIVTLELVSDWCVETYYNFWHFVRYTIEIIFRIWRRQFSTLRSITNSIRTFSFFLEKDRSANNYSSLPKERRDFPTFLGVYRSLPRESTFPLLSRPQISRYLYSHANLDKLRFDKLPDIFDLQAASPLPYLSRLIYFP